MVVGHRLTHSGQTDYHYLSDLPYLNRRTHTQIKFLIILPMIVAKSESLSQQNIYSGKIKEFPFTVFNI